MKKILYIHHGVGIGGAPISLLNLIKPLDRTKYHPIILFLFESPAIDLFRNAGIEVLGPVNYSDFSHTKIWWYRWYHVHHLVRALWGTYKILTEIGLWWIAKIKPDIIHLNTTSLWPWAVVARKMGIRVICHVREPLAPGYLGLRRALVRWAVGRYADDIVAICKNDARPWATLAKTQVLYNAVDCAKFMPAQVMMDKPFTIGYVGGLSKEKGVLAILQAVQLLHARGHKVRLMIAGFWPAPHSLPVRHSFSDGGSGFLQKNVSKGWQKIRDRIVPSDRYRKKVEKLVQELGEYVHIFGVVNNMHEIMRQMDVVTFPATVGHFARPIIEAGALGKPVIASDVPPLDELVEDGVTGFLIPPHDVAAWADALQSLMYDFELAHLMSLAGRENVENKFSLAQQAKKVDQIYSQ